MDTSLLGRSLAVVGIASLGIHPPVVLSQDEDGFFGQVPIVLSATRLSQPTLDSPSAVTIIDRAMIDASGREVRLEIDGGITVDNVAEVAASGVDTFVSGSAIFGSGDYRETISRMKADAD